MSDLELFQFDGFDVRVVDIDGKPWFVHNDVCAILDLRNPSDALLKINSAWVGQTEVTDALGRPRMTTILNQSGVLKLVVRSDKPEAARLTDYIIDVIVPEWLAGRGRGQQRELTVLEQLQAGVEAERGRLAALAERDQAMEMLEVTESRAITAESALHSQAALLDAIQRQHSDLLIGEVAKFLTTYLPKPISPSELRSKYREWNWMEQRKNAPRYDQMCHPGCTYRFNYRRHEHLDPVTGRIMHVTLTPTVTPKGLLDTAKRLISEQISQEPLWDEDE